MRTKFKNIIEIVLLVALLLFVANIYLELFRYQRITTFSKIMIPALFLAYIAQEIVNSPVGDKSRGLSSNQMIIAGIGGLVVIYIFIIFLIKPEPLEYFTFLCFFVVAALAVAIRYKFFPRE